MTLAVALALVILSTLTVRRICGGLGAASLSLGASVAAPTLFFLDLHRDDRLFGDISHTAFIAIPALAAVWNFWHGHLRWRPAAAFVVAAGLVVALDEASYGQLNWGAHSLLSLALMPHLLARRETTPRPAFAAWLYGLLAGVSYALLIPVYTPLFSLCVAVLISGLLQPSLAVLSRRYRHPAPFAAVGLLLLGGLLVLQNRLADANTLLQAAEHANIASVRPALTALFLCTLVTVLLSRYVAPWVAKWLENRRENRHERLADADSLVLRARVTGALHRGSKQNTPKSQRDAVKKNYEQT